jgi:hypothetical protein
MYLLDKLVELEAAWPKNKPQSGDFVSQHYRYNKSNKKARTKKFFARAFFRQLTIAVVNSH